MSFQEQLQHEHYIRYSAKDAQKAQLMRIVHSEIENEAQERYRKFSEIFAKHIIDTGNRIMDGYQFFTRNWFGFYASGYETHQTLLREEDFQEVQLDLGYPEYGDNVTVYFVQYHNDVIEFTPYYFDFVDAVRKLASADNIWIYDPVCEIKREGHHRPEIYTFEQIMMAKPFRIRNKTLLGRRTRASINYLFTAEYRGPM